MELLHDKIIKDVATLALGSRPGQKGVARLWAKREPGSVRKCEGV